MAKLGDLIVRVGADTTQLNKKLGDARKSIAKNTREIQQLGRNMTVGITAPLALMGASSVQAFREQSKAIAQVEAGLKSTAGQVGMTSQELQKMATDLQNKTLFGDEVILKDATAQLLTFTNITGEQFARTQAAALDLATRLDGDLKSASIQLGKALNDPIANLSALSRSGIQFSKKQKEVIKSLTETGRLAEAQTLILDELNKQYGGSAEAAAEADGGFTQLANSFGDLQEEIGRLLVDYLRPIVDQLKTFVQFLQGTSDGTKNVALAISGIAAAIGPVLLILPNLISGIKAANTVFGFLNKTILANPFALAATALALVVTGIIMLTDETKKAVTAVDALTEANKNLTLEEQKRNIEVQIEQQKKLVEQLEAEKAAKDKIAEKFGGKAIKEQKEANAAFATANSELATMNTMLDEVNKKLEKTPVIIEEVEDETEDLTTKSRELKNTIGFLINELEEVPSENIWKPTEDGAKDLTQTLGGLMNMLEEIPAATVDTQPLTQAEQDFEDFAESVSKAIETAAESAAIGFGMMLGEGIATGKGMKGVGAMLLGVFADLAIQLGTLAIGYGIAIDSIKAALGSINGVLAVAAGVALVALGAGIKGAITKRAEGAGVPAFADGAIVSGPTLGLVGEYPGAKTNPEVIAPLDKLRSMMGGQHVQVTGKISGRDILLTSERNAIDRNRVRGF